jgi:hypothetical protein
MTPISFLALIATVICTIGCCTFLKTARLSAADDAPRPLVIGRYGVAAMMATGAVLSSVAMWL